MRKIYCDFCGNETDPLDNGIEIEYAIGEEKLSTLSYRDMCWDCRTCVARTLVALSNMRSETRTLTPTGTIDYSGANIVLGLQNKLTDCCSDCNRQEKCIYVEQLARENLTNTGD